MAELRDADLQSAGLVVSEISLASGVAAYSIKGETHPLRTFLREIGGRWDGVKRVWIFEGDDPRPALREHLAVGQATGGLSDVLPDVELPNRPHYWGHRQRLRDRFLEGADTALPDYELLELLLFFAIRRVDTKPLAKALLARFGTLAGVANATVEQLAEFEQVDHFVITLLKAIRIVSMRLTHEDLTERPVLDNWEKLVAYLRASMAHRPVEQFRLLFLDRRNVLIADEVQQQGTVDHTPVYPREVMKRALVLEASALVMVHNHPSNHPQPSKPDIDMTRQLRDALDKVGIVLHDHLIVSRRGHTSFRELGLLDAKGR